MLIDSRQFAPDFELKADACVIGGGPLGVAVARELNAAGLHVILLESGGTEADPVLNREGDANNFDFGAVKSFNNTRQLGGNANAWCVRTPGNPRSVRIAPLSPVDFDEKASDPGSAWPFGHNEMVPLYSRAQRFLGLPNEISSYGPNRWAGGIEDQLLDERDIRSGVFQFANAKRLVDKTVADLTKSTTIRTILHATALEILTNDDGSVATGVRVASQPGREFVVHARHVVLAAGAISTTQLLLASNAAQPQGLGNHFDQLGRNFMDHLLIEGGHLVPSSKGDFARRSFYDIRVVEGTPVLGYLQLSPEAIRRDALLGLNLLMFPREEVAQVALSERQNAGFRAALRVRERLVRRRLPYAADLRNMVSGIDGVVKVRAHRLRHPVSSLGRGGWSSQAMRDYAYFDVMHQAEQSPHPENRITLSQVPDSFGLRKVDIRVRWQESDISALARAQDVMARALSDAGWGEFVPARSEGRPVLHSPSSNHFMGTTRMNASPRLGVVDPSGAVHGTKNLFVASTSVLPTGGWANVTLTGIALALRSADAIVKNSLPTKVQA